MLEGCATRSFQPVLADLLGLVVDQFLKNFKMLFSVPSRASPSCDVAHVNVAQ